MNAIRYPYTRKKKRVDNIEDILDGEIYKSFELLKTYGNISLLLNTDGLTVFKSGGKKLWPITVVINELHPSLRFYFDLKREKR